MARLREDCMGRSILGFSVTLPVNHQIPLFSIHVCLAVIAKHLRTVSRAVRELYYLLLLPSMDIFSCSIYLTNPKVLLSTGQEHWGSYTSRTISFFALTVTFILLFYFILFYVILFYLFYFCALNNVKGFTVKVILAMHRKTLLVQIFE